MVIFIGTASSRCARTPSDTSLFVKVGGSGARRKACMPNPQNKIGTGQQSTSTPKPQRETAVTGVDDDGEVRVFDLQDQILPALDVFSPELIIVSAGFDAHERDPRGSLTMTADDFAWVTRELMKSAEKLCDGRL